MTRIGNQKFLIFSLFLLLSLFLSQETEARFRRGENREARFRSEHVKYAVPRVVDLRRLDNLRGDNYYDEVSDKKNATMYYDRILANVTRNLNFEALSELLTSTHERVYSYSAVRAQFLYPFVDRHRNDSLVCIYTRMVLADGPRESSNQYNCEHTVPQSWFQKKTPMVSDLHHLYASENNCNNFRSNYIFGDYFQNKEGRSPLKEKPGCGLVFSQSGSNSWTGFEAFAKEGRGATARSTLYFFVRYPGIISRAHIPERNLKEIKEMAKSIPILEWERHRNAAIAIAQGNRNPFIDHNEWIDKIDFTKGYAN